MKKAKLLRLEQMKELTSGKFEGSIIYNAYFDNDDQGELFVFKGSKPPEIENDYEYEVQETDYGNKIKLKKESSGGGRSFGAVADPKKAASIERQSSLKAGLEYCIFYGNKTEWKPTPNDVIQVAEVFNTWVHGSKPEEKKQEQTEKIADVPLEEEENKLPF